MGHPRSEAAAWEILPKDTAVEDFLVEHEFPGIGQRKMLLNARRVCRTDANRQLILLAIEDITKYENIHHCCLAGYGRLAQTLEEES